MRGYESDYAGWAEDQSAAIRERRWSDVDQVALADEVGNLAREERRALRNRLAILMAYLLQQRYQAEKASRSWQAMVNEQRLRIRKILEESPSLRAQLNDAIVSAYAIARLPHAKLSCQSRRSLSLFRSPAKTSDFSSFTAIPKHLLTSPHIDATFLAWC